MAEDPSNVVERGLGMVAIVVIQAIYTRKIKPISAFILGRRRLQRIPLLLMLLVAAEVVVIVWSFGPRPLDRTNPQPVIVDS